MTVPADLLHKRVVNKGSGVIGTVTHTDERNGGQVTAVDDDGKSHVAPLAMWLPVPAEDEALHTSTHWHVRAGGVDTELFTGDTVYLALEYAGAELNSLADWLHDGITVAGDAGLYKLAYSRFQLAFTYWQLAEDATELVNHYHHHDHDQGPRGRELLDTALTVVDMINAGTPDGVSMIYECSLDECAPTEG